MHVNIKEKINTCEHWILIDVSCEMRMTHAMQITHGIHLMHGIQMIHVMKIILK